jgi:hypothetical protein
MEARKKYFTIFSFKFFICSVKTSVLIQTNQKTVSDSGTVEYEAETLMKSITAFKINSAYLKWSESRISFRIHLKMGTVVPNAIVQKMQGP